MGQTLYVTEQQPHLTQVLMYDLNDSDLHHENTQKRKITCSNRRPLVVYGLGGDPELIIPCPHTNTLYILEYHPDHELDAVVHRVKPDGTVLSRWLFLDLPACLITSMALNPSGSYLAVLISDRVNFYSTANGHLVSTKEIADENRQEKMFACSTFQDDSIESVVTMTSPKRHWYPQRDTLASDNHQCLLMMTYPNFTLFNKSLSRQGEIAIKQLAPKKYWSSHFWYDKDRGLVFCQRDWRLEVVRVTL